MRPSLLPALVLALAVSACTTAEPPPPPPPDVTNGLTELGDVYKYRGGQRLPAPGKAEDLVESEPALPNAWPLIQSGAVVVVWKAGYAANSADVLAYEKDAPTQGGKVLLRNGTVKPMTADEFRAARK